MTCGHEVFMDSYKHPTYFVVFVVESTIHIPFVTHYGAM
jgi:hypothetical protein